jgi:DNA (cytosine-5)-methyltransferase 1
MDSLILHTMKAIDLYSGIGGWTLGLKMAGIEVVASYEWWNEANRTHNLNFGKSIPETDIRKLKMSDLPMPGTIDFVVGSPPCTQFSYANRGGSGDIGDGLIDIFQFLSVVEYLKPKYWAFENVPRVSQILKVELAKGGRLERFGKMVKVNQVFDISAFGLPQKRTRAIIGDYPVELLEAYKSKTKQLNLRNVVESLAKFPAIDPIYGFELERDELTDHVKEDVLDPEEARLNREQKAYHPVFNGMQFPDSLDRPARTVTALCTRVSRESIVIAEDDAVRRLTIRERALLQGFPITYQFYGKSYEAKIKMIGNAVPPLMTFFVAQSMLEIQHSKMKSPTKPVYRHAIPAIAATITPPSDKGKKFSETRKFKAAIPGLRFGSGMRFELENIFNAGAVEWKVNFFFGNSKDIRSTKLDAASFENSMDLMDSKHRKQVLAVLTPLAKVIRKSSPEAMQLSWTHRDPGLHPYKLCDLIGEAAAMLVPISGILDDELLQKHLVDTISGPKSTILLGEKKLFANIRQIFVGIVVGSWVNSVLETVPTMVTA